jgi:hypothetical protein
MGYAGFSLKKILAPFSSVAATAPEGRRRSWHAEAQNYSWDEPNSVSGFQQLIVVEPFPSAASNQKQLAGWAPKAEARRRRLPHRLRTSAM